MRTMQLTGTSGADGLMTVTLPMESPSTVYEIVVQATAVKPTPAIVDPWKEINEFRERLAASGRTFGNSVEEIREDRDR